MVRRDSSCCGLASCAPTAAINVVQRRAHLSHCFSGCCCGRTERGYAAVPVDTFKGEWLRRKLRKVVHLTKAGCPGPCAHGRHDEVVVIACRGPEAHELDQAHAVRLIREIA